MTPIAVFWLCTAVFAYMVLGFGAARIVARQRKAPMDFVVVCAWPVALTLFAIFGDME
jgi:hypothetical protein